MKAVRVRKEVEPRRPRLELYFSGVD